MMTVWDKFQDPTWQQDALRHGPPKEQNLWAITRASDYDNKPMDTPKERQHKLTVKDWLFKNNLTEELLLNHPSPADVKLFQEIHKSTVYSYFDSSDIAMLNAYQDKVVIRRLSLNQQQLDKISHAVIRAERLYKRNIKRKGIGNGKEQYELYKLQVKKAYQDIK